MKNNMKELTKKLPQTNLTIILLCISLIMIIAISKPFLESRPAKQLLSPPTRGQPTLTDTSVFPPPIGFALQENY